MSSPADAQLLINLLTPKGASAGKALRLGRKFVGLGWRVTLLIQADGVRLLDPAADLEPCPVTGRSPAAALPEFLAAGGRGLVGKDCLQAHGLENLALPGGLDHATVEGIAEILASPDVRTLSF